MTVSMAWLLFLSNPYDRTESSKTGSGVMDVDRNLKNTIELENWTPLLSYVLQVRRYKKHWIRLEYRARSKSEFIGHVRECKGSEDLLRTGDRVPNGDWT